VVMVVLIIMALIVNLYSINTSNKSLNRI